MSEYSLEKKLHPLSKNSGKFVKETYW